MIYHDRKIVFPGDLNATHTLFGGRAMAWIDESAAVFASCQMDCPHLVTAHISNLTFRSPSKTGDVIEIGCEVVSVGRSSLTIRVNMRNKTTHQDIVSVDKMVFVRVDPSTMKPQPISDNAPCKKGE